LLRATSKLHDVCGNGCKRQFYLLQNTPIYTDSSWVNPSC
jgi:hypothetical protein